MKPSNEITNPTAVLAGKHGRIQGAAQACTTARRNTPPQVRRPRSAGPQRLSVEIIAELPDLTPEEVREALLYAAQAATILANLQAFDGVTLQPCLLAATPECDKNPQETYSR
jgi:uncharacterized protein (DUF433 family)